VQWADAVAEAAHRFSVHVPPHLAAAFNRVGWRENHLLNLTLSLRTHRAERVQEWVAALIDARTNDAARLAPELHESGFDLYVTDDLEKAKRYVRRRYAEEPEKRYGLLASSKAGNLRDLGVDNEWEATRRLKIGPWFNAPADDPLSCCQLDRPVTEFQCQGLELDMPIVCWGDDLGWADGQWKSFRRTLAARDSHQLRLNSYRVLLTRGRDGVIMFVPQNLREDQSAAVVEVLRTAGVVAL